MLICSGHHAAHHEGRLIIEGSIATGLVFKHADGTPYGAAREVKPAASVAADATAALRSAGFAPREARGAVEAAISHVGASASIEAVLQAALRASRPGGGRPARAPAAK